MIDFPSDGGIVERLSIERLTMGDRATALFVFANQSNSGDVCLQAAASSAVALASTFPNDVVTDGSGEAVTTA